MPEWFNQFSTGQADPTLSVLGTRLLLAWLCGWIVAMLARRSNAGTPDTLTLTLVLMSILIAMATQIIGDNVARAFSLVGALSIVRFRTAVPATRDVAFVLAAVVVGMASGAGQYWVSALGLVVVALATHFNTPRSIHDRSGKTTQHLTETWRLTLQVGLSSTDAWIPELRRLTESFQLTSAETARRGSATELVYRVVPKPETTAVDLVAELNKLPAVESAAAKLL